MPRSPTQTACQVCWRRTSPGEDAERSCIETAAWPVVHLISVGKNSDEMIHCRLRQLESMMQGDNYFSLIIDPRQSKSGDRNTIFVEWSKANQALLQRHCAGVALIVRSVLVRFVLSGVLLVFSSPIPYKAFEREEEAMAWAHAQAQRRPTPRP